LKSSCFSLNNNNPYQKRPLLAAATTSAPSSLSTPAAFVRDIILEQNNNHDAKQKQQDFTTVPPEALLLHNRSTTKRENGNNEKGDGTHLAYSSDLIPRHFVTAESYLSTTKQQHMDCLALFGDNDDDTDTNYSTKLTRCQVIDETNVNMQWVAQWIPSTSTWLYSLANFMSWNVERKMLPYDIMTTFSWKNVGLTFQKAFQTGTINLPIMLVEGNTILTCDWYLEDETNDIPTDKVDATTTATAGKIKKGYCKSVKENIYLVNEADNNRLCNRRVAQELAAWLDVSRRPFPTSPPPPSSSLSNKDIADDNNKEWWSSLVQQRIISGVSGAGPLDIDPNEDDREGIAALISFGFICVVGFALSYDFLMEQSHPYGDGVAGLCEEVDLGFGYYSDCL